MEQFSQKRFSVILLSTMGVLTPRLHTLYSVARFHINSSVIFSVHISAKSPQNPQTTFENLPISPPKYSIVCCFPFLFQLGRKSLHTEFQFPRDRDIYLSCIKTLQRMLNNRVLANFSITRRDFLFVQCSVISSPFVAAPKQFSLCTLKISPCNGAALM